MCGERSCSEIPIAKAQLHGSVWLCKHAARITDSTGSAQSHEDTPAHNTFALHDLARVDAAKRCNVYDLWSKVERDRAQKARTFYTASKGSVDRAVLVSVLAAVQWSGILLKQGFITSATPILYGCGLRCSFASSVGGRSLPGRLSR